MNEISNLLGTKVKSDIKLLREDELEVVQVSIAFGGNSQATYTFTHENFKPEICEGCDEEMEQEYKCENCGD